MNTQLSIAPGMSRRAFLSGLGALGLGLALGACSNGSDGTGAPAGEPASDASGSAATASDASGSTAAPAAGKVLVAYFSAQGHTERVAQELASVLGADSFEIVPAEPYTDDDLDFNEESSRVVQEYENEDQRDTPLAQDAPDDFASYDTVLVGYPIWWGDSAWAMRRFVTDNDLTGKTVIPFCTSLSSGLGQSGENLAALAGTGDWLGGQRFSENADLADVDDWAAGLGL